MVLRSCFFVRCRAVQTRSKIRWAPYLAVLATLLAGPSPAAESDRGPLGLSADEQWDALVPGGEDYMPVLSAPVWVVPSDRLPGGVRVDTSNNTLSIAQHDGRLFLAWRTAPSHFASSRTRLCVISSPDSGITWTKETEIALGRDLREPFLLSVGSRLFLHFAELGDNPLAFSPHLSWRSERKAAGQWSRPVLWGAP